MGGRAAQRGVALALATAITAAACDNPDLLEVDDPDVIPPEDLNSPAGRDAQFSGAIFDFALGYGGAAGGGSFEDGIVTTSAYMSDEGILSGTFPTRREFDQRDVDKNNGTLAEMFWRVHRARRSAETAAQVLADAATEANTADERVARMFNLAGFTYVAFGENFCSGVPFSTELPGGEPATTVETFEIALERFNEAAAAGAAEADADLARIGQGRALLNLGRFADAAAAVADVPTNVVFRVEHSINTEQQENGWNAANRDTRRISVADNEGGNGTSFRSAEDPRLTTEALGEGFDNQTETHGLMDYPASAAVIARDASMPLATGIEARLIEAEAALQAGDATQFLAKLNEARQAAPNGGDLEPLTDPGSEDERVDMLFRERGFLLFATGHRLGDLRRLIRQYGRAESDVFPTGGYFKGGDYGPDVNLIIPIEEENNPNFAECLDREA